MERKWPPSKSPGMPNDFRKKIPSKQKLSSKETSAEELVNADESRIQNTHLNSRVTEEGNARTTTTRKLGMERKRTHSESSEKPHSAAKATETSKRTNSSKGNVSQIILPNKDSSSNQLVKGGKSRIQNDQLNSGVKTCKEINFRKDRSSDESADSAISQATSGDKRSEKTSSSFTDPSSKKTRIGRKKMFNSKDSLTLETRGTDLEFLSGFKNENLDKSADDAIYRTRLHFGATSGDKRCEKEPCSLTTSSLSKKKTSMGSKEISYRFNNDMIKIDPKNIPDTEKSLKKPTGSVFEHWGKNLEVKTHSKGNDEHKDSTQRISKLVDKESANKEWEKARARFQERTKRTDLYSYKIDKVDDKVPINEGCIKNIADPSAFPVTAENKQILKRLSDPSNTPKENRSPSI